MQGAVVKVSEVEDICSSNLNSYYISNSYKHLHLLLLLPDCPHM